MPRATTPVTLLAHTHTIHHTHVTNSTRRLTRLAHHRHHDGTETTCWQQPDGANSGAWGAIRYTGQNEDFKVLAETPAIHPSLEIARAAVT